jgi:tetratricopeptide (TPR) repeat protein
MLDPTATAAAERLFEQAQYDAALAAWQAIATDDPGSARARGRIGACLVALSRSAEAAPILEEAASARPDQPLLQHCLAVARAGLGDMEGALRALEAAAEAGLRLASGVDAEPALARVRDDPRFAAIRARIARNDAPTADQPGFRSFDFWIGDWEARTEDGVLQGHNRIERLLGGAAILERWTGATGFRGTSLNRYDRRTGTWRQTWVDDQGDITEFEDGTVRDGRLTFGALDADGGRHRLTFEDRGPDAFRQLAERSDDGGRTWTVEYDFRYRRLDEPDGDETAGPDAGRDPAG